MQRHISHSAEVPKVLGNPLHDPRQIGGLLRPGCCWVNDVCALHHWLCCAAIPKLCVVPHWHGTQFGKCDAAIDLGHGTQKQLPSHLPLPCSDLASAGLQPTRNWITTHRIWAVTLLEVVIHSLRISGLDHGGY